MFFPYEFCQLFQLVLIPQKILTYNKKDTETHNSYVEFTMTCSSKKIKPLFGDIQFDTFIYLLCSNTWDWHKFHTLNSYVFILKKQQQLNWKERKEKSLGNLFYLLKELLNCQVNPATADISLAPFHIFAFPPRV